MKNPVKYFQKSLSRRLSLWILFYAMVILFASLGYLFHVSARTVRREAISDASQKLEITVLRLTNILNQIEIATDETERQVNLFLNSPDSMIVYSQRILKNHSILNGCAISFEPYYFKDHGRYFSVFSHNQDGEIETMFLGSDQYEYFYMDWYQLPILLDKPVWTEPYFSSNPANHPNEMIASYCKPIKNSQGRIVGSIAVDITINWLSQTISAVKPYPNSYSVLIGCSGTYFVHPDTTKQFYQTIFTETLIKPDTAITSLGHAMQRGEDGVREMKINGKDSYIFYKPISNTGWSMAIVCTKNDIDEKFLILRNKVLTIVALGLILTFMSFIRVVKRELRPLKQLAQKAETIASGHFDVTMPKFKHLDEIGQLSQSFANMQTSLVKYIDELKETTAQKASIERDLIIGNRIQMSMIRRNYPPFPERDDIAIYGLLNPAKAVGGDLYDFYIRDEKLFFCIGDVSGKGVAGALVMAVTFTLFRTVSTTESDPGRIISWINQSLVKGNKSNMFITFLVGVLDLPTGRLSLCNAGHCLPLIFDNDVSELPLKPYFPIGLFPNVDYKSYKTQIIPGATIFLYTDGLVEAERADFQLFGKKRMMEVAADVLGNHAPQTVIEHMTDAAHTFVAGNEQNDDLTMLAVQYTKVKRDVVLQRNITVLNEKAELAKVSQFVASVVGEFDFPLVTREMLNLAIEEAIVNVINYAYPKGQHGDVGIEAVASNERLKFVISDSGMPFDPTRKTQTDISLPIEERPVGGMGIHLVRQIMDSVNYERIDGKNILTLRKNITNNKHIINKS